MKLSGVTVIYNPDKNVHTAIESYLPFLSKLYIVDNSSKNNEKIFAQYKNPLR